MQIESAGSVRNAMNVPVADASHSACKEIDRQHPGRKRVMSMKEQLYGHDSIGHEIIFFIHL